MSNFFMIKLNSRFRMKSRHGCESILLWWTLNNTMFNLMFTVNILYDITSLLNVDTSNFLVIWFFLIPLECHSHYFSHIFDWCQTVIFFFGFYKSDSLSVENILFVVINDHIWHDLLQNSQVFTCSQYKFFIANLFAVFYLMIK